MRAHSISVRAHTVSLLMACLLAVTPLAHAQQPGAPFTVTLTPSSTSVHWTLNTTIHTVHGTFRLTSGTIRIDPATGNASGLIVVDATSGQSGDEARDRRMHGSILESGLFPEVTFRPTHVSGHLDLNTGGDITVDGAFHLHGTDHPLQLLIHLQPGGKLSTHFVIPFVAWGIKDPSTFVFRTEKQVALDIDAAYTTAPERASARVLLQSGETYTAQ